MDATTVPFGRLARDVVKAAGLISEISSASAEQAVGIAQTNNALTEIGRVVQDTAGSAEENAGQASELNHQAQQIREWVGMLTSLINGRRKAIH